MTSHDLGARVIVVTGAAQGQGHAEALAAAKAGATVIAADISEEVGAGFGQISSIHVRRLDVSDADSWAELASWVEASWGRVDGLVNNAGVTSRVRLGDVTLTDWNRVLAINTTGPMLGIQALLPLMSAGSSIVNVGSTAGLMGHYTAAYTTSKWALRGLTQVAATEFGPRGIRTNVVHPGFIHTAMTASAPPAFEQIHNALTPMSRAGESDEVAQLVIFLLSPASSYINGAEITVDGGFTRGGCATAISDALKAVA